MSKLTQVTCDGCGTVAPDGYVNIFPSWSGWITVNGPGYDDHLDVCSTACLATVVAPMIPARDGAGRGKRTLFCVDGADRDGRTR